MFDERIATDVSAAQNSREIAGYTQITATAAPGHTLGELEAVILEEVARLKADGPTDDEIERGRVQAETQFVFRLQTVGGFGGKSDQLNAYNVFLRDPAYFDRDLARYREATRESLRDATMPLSRSLSSRDAQHRAARPRSLARRFLTGGRFLMAPDRIVLRRG